MIGERLLHLNGPLSDDGLPHLEETVAYVLESARAGHVRRLRHIGTDRSFVAGMPGDAGVQVDLAGDPGRPAPTLRDAARMIVDALDREATTQARLDDLHLAMGSIATFLHTDHPHVLMRTATPWQTVYACGCPCPFRSSIDVGSQRMELVIDDDLATLLPDATSAVHEDRRLVLRPVQWGGSHSPIAIAGAGGHMTPGMPDPMTALRTVHALRTARDARSPATDAAPLDPDGHRPPAEGAGR
jgi:hypothetical protein